MTTTMDYATAASLDVAGEADISKSDVSSAVISITNLNKTFNKKTTAISSLSLTVNEGEMVALIGPSGSGKSTLLRHINGLILGDKDEAGEVQAFGKTIQRRGQRTRQTRQSRKRIGFIFQQFNLVNRSSVLTNVLIGALGSIPAWRGSIGWFTQAEKDRALQALERVGMAKFALQRASTLSGGQQQRVAIARALMQQADIILADEPIASLDPASATRVMQILKEINELDKKTVVVTLHQVNYAKNYCQRAVALKEGQLYYDGSAEDLNESRLTALYEDDEVRELLEAEPASQTAQKKAPITATV